jgi:hypothetical protein
MTVRIAAVPDGRSARYLRHERRFVRQEPDGSLCSSHHRDVREGSMAGTSLARSVDDGRSTLRIDGSNLLVPIEALTGDPSSGKATPCSRAGNSHTQSHGVRQDSKQDFR